MVFLLRKLFVNKKDLLITSVLVLLLLPFIYISLFIHPIADDFTYAVKGRTYDIFDNLVGEYLNWNGRYFSNLLVIINPITYGWFGLYKVIPIVLIVFTVFAFYIFTSAIFTRNFKSQVKFQISLILTLLYLHQMPDLAEGIYWYTGAVTYHLGNIIFLITASLLALQYNNRYVFSNKVIHYFIFVILLFLLNGMNEIHVIILWLFFGTILIAYFSYNKKLNVVVLLLLIASLLFSLILILSPGNEVRAAHFSENHRLWNSLLMSSAQTIRFLGEWLWSLPLLFASLLFLYFRKWLNEKMSLLASSFFLKPWQSLLIIPAVIFIGAFPAYWGTGILGQHRTMNVSYFLFLIIWFVNLTICFNYLSRCNFAIRYKFLLNLNHTKEIILISGLFLSLILTGNSYTVLSDLISSRAHNFSKQMEDRYQIIKNSKDTAFIRTIYLPPESIFVSDVSTDPNDWVNRSYGLYFSEPEKTIVGVN